MTALYRRLKAEVLADHAKYDYKQAYQMPLTDRVDAPKERQAEYKRIAQELTDDPDFPYTVMCWIQGKDVKIGYRPHK